MEHCQRVVYFEVPCVSFHFRKTGDQIQRYAYIVGGITYNNLIQSVELAREMQNNNEPMIDAIDYKDTNVSTKVVKIIQSYKDIINRNTWKEMTMRIAIEKIIGLLKNQSSKNRMLRFIAWRILQTQNLMAITI